MAREHPPRVAPCSSCMRRGGALVAHGRKPKAESAPIDDDDLLDDTEIGGKPGKKAADVPEPPNPQLFQEIDME